MSGRSLCKLMVIGGLFANAFALGASSVKLAWNANPETNVVGYRLSYGTTLGTYPNVINVGTSPSATVPNLTEGTTYYFVVAAINNAGQQSAASAVVSYWVPTLTSTNRAPVALANSLTVPEDTVSNVVLAGTDADGNSLTFSIVRAPAKGALSGTAPNLKYTPTADYSGSDSFTFIANDGSLNSPPATVSITVTPVNDGPVATSKSAATNKNTQLPVLLGGSDKDSFTLTYSIVAAPTKGTLQGTPPSLTYIPSANYVGTDQFTFRVNDGALNSAVATISITVAQVATAPTTPTTPTTPTKPPVVTAPQNAAPVFTSSPIYLADANEGTAYSGKTLAGQASDSQAITYSKVSGPAWLGVATNGVLSGTPPLGSAGVNSFIVRATDSLSLSSDAELRINVTLLPVPWQTRDVGTGQLAGSVSYNIGTFTQTGSGALGGTKDNLRFSYQMLSNDGAITAKVSSLQATGTWVRAGVMIRDSLATNSRQVFMGLTNSSSYRWVSRVKAGGKTTTKNSTTSAGTDTWVRLIRNGGRVFSYKSSNGINWTYVGATRVTMAAECYVGLAVSSGGNAAVSTVQFSNVTVDP